MWGVEEHFSVPSKKIPESNVQIDFKGRKLEGWVAKAKTKRGEYRLWSTKQLSYELKDAFLMSFARDVEDRLRKSKAAHNLKSIFCYSTLKTSEK
jgi:hypothetical protein